MMSLAFKISRDFVSCKTVTMLKPLFYEKLFSLIHPCTESFIGFPDRSQIMTQRLILNAWLTG